MTTLGAARQAPGSATQAQILVPVAAGHDLAPDPHPKLSDEGWGRPAAAGGRVWCNRSGASLRAREMPTETRMNKMR
jgi:hypothetical protein